MHFYKHRFLCWSRTKRYVAMLTAKCFFPLVCGLLNVLNMVNFGIFDRGLGSKIVSPSARHLPSRHRRHRRQNAKEGLQSHFFCNEARGPSQSPRQAVFRGKTVVDGEEMRKKLPFIPQIKLPRFVSPPASSRMLASWASRRPHF